MRRAMKQEPDETEEDLDYEDDEPGEDFVEDTYEETDSEKYDGISEDEEDEFYEDGGFYDGGDGDEADDSELPEEADEKPSSRRDPLESLKLRAEAIWATVLAQARGVELPGKPEINLKRAGKAAAIVFASIAVGAGAYLIGKGTGNDVDQARLEGETAGKQAGAMEGAAEGYAAGFRKGRERGFRKAYASAYRVYYKRAFEQVGLDVPRARDIDVPAP